jgi:hypothetical protein
MTVNRHHKRYAMAPALTDCVLSHQLLGDVMGRGMQRLLLMASNKIMGLRMLGYYVRDVASVNGGCTCKLTWGGCGVLQSGAMSDCLAAHALDI